MKKGKEKAKIWRVDAFDNMELLKAQYVSQVFPKHYHDTFCIGVIEQGAEFLAFTDKKIIANAGKVVLIDPLDVHTNYAFDKEGWKYRMIYLNPDAFTFFGGNQVQIMSQVIDQPQLFQLVLHFHQLAETGQTNTFLLQQIVQWIVKINFKTPLKPKKDKLGRFQMAKSFIEEKYTEKINLVMLEKVVALNKFKLIRMFKKELGLTPFEYILLLRIKQAKTQLRQKQTLSQVALDAGFYDQSNFTHYFKKYTGVSPLVYQKGCNILQDKQPKDG